MIYVYLFSCRMFTKFKKQDILQGQSLKEDTLTANTDTDSKKDKLDTLRRELNNSRVGLLGKYKIPYRMTHMNNTKPNGKVSQKIRFSTNISALQIQSSTITFCSLFC